MQVVLISVHLVPELISSASPPPHKCMHGPLVLLLFVVQI
uniref:Uncharacterized protein n=1 Tax=Anguilla anguilla TaxID=7936 RepID=A0A0E9WAP0_ANGAN